jgi:4'-phosphopantetheinyl transferase
VHVWHLHADRLPDRFLQHFASLLSPDEAARHARITHERTRREHLLARGLVRTVLAGYTGVAAEALEFVADTYGKPMVSPRSRGRLAELHFNLSHSHGVVVCAVGGGRQVGIDVENRLREVEYLALAERYFAAAEFAHLQTLDGADLQSAFFAIWTLKEAFVKAIGQGLSFPLDSFAFRLDVDRLVGFRPPPVPGSWRFVQFEPTPQHRGALAVACDGTDLRMLMRDWLSVVD